MKWSWRIGKIAGIRVYMHATFLILLGFVGLHFYMQRQSLADALGGILYIIILFGIVVLHELGHALTARRYGIGTRDITLLPIGGLARLERMPEDPVQELVIALAGPAVNVVLAFLLFGIHFAVAGFENIAQVSMVGGNYLATFMWINVFLAAFNMLPAFPMDGGRVLRALLATQMNYVRATKLAASIGQGMAFVFGFAGLFINPFLVIIALFVWMGAAQEASMVELKSALQGVPISDAMITNFRTVSPDDTLARAVEHILGGSQQDFPVVEDDHLVGLLTRADLMRALAEHGKGGSVGEVMQRSYQTANPDEMLEKVFARLREGESRTLPVLDNGKLVGMLTMDNVGEFVMIQSALREAKP